MNYVNQEHKDFINKLHDIVKSKNLQPHQAEGNVYWHSLEQIDEEPWDNYDLKRELINRLASHVTEVLEIGLNAGHSASIWLFTNPSIKVKAIDIEHRPYTRECAELLKQTFPDRFEYFSGDSRKVFPEQNEHFKNCDLIHIDGGHDMPIFREDFLNAYNLPHNVSERKLLIDDADFPGIEPLWKFYLEQNDIRIWNLPNFNYREYHTVLVKQS
jgi:hypothetical protein